MTHNVPKHEGSVMNYSGSVKPSEMSILSVVASKVEHGLPVMASDIHELRSLATRDRKAIPYLNRSFWNNQNLQRQVMVVRYIGMVQDMLETEYYVTYVNGVATHYRDIYHDDDDKDCKAANDTIPMHKIADTLSERHLLVVVPIPFTSPWFAKMAFDCPNDDNENMLVDKTPQKLKTQEGQIDETNEACKRQFGNAVGSCLPDYDTACVGCKSMCGAEHQSVEWWPAGCMKNDERQSPVLAKMYYNQLHQPHDLRCRRLRLNDIVELIGVISPPQIVSELENEQDKAEEERCDGCCDADDEANLVLPPPILLPRLHVLSYKILDLDVMTLEVASRTHELKSHKCCCAPVKSLDQRDTVIEDLAKFLLNGDSIAAEALLMALLSQAERDKRNSQAWNVTKTPSNNSLGCASLNLVTPDAVTAQQLFEQLYQVIQQIVPVISVLDASHKGWEVPMKDRSGRLIPSSLQLPKGSTVLILLRDDVPTMSPSSLEALETLSRCHSLSYQFGDYFKNSLEADYRIIVVSTKPFATCLMKVRVKSMLSRRNTDPPQNLMERIRHYLAKRRSHTTKQPVDEKDATSSGFCNVVLPKEVLHQAQHDFVHRRANISQQQNIPQVQEDDLHRWLTLTRLEAWSRGNPTNHQPKLVATLDDWNAALRLDDAMCATWKTDRNSHVLHPILALENVT